MQLRPLAYSCVICQSPLLLLGHRQGHAYASCSVCASVQLAPMPSSQDLDAWYRQDYHKAGHSDISALQNLTHRRNIFEFVAMRILGLGAFEDRLVVELGAGWGSFGLVAREMGLPYLGIEPSEAMASYARSQGLDVRQGGLELLEQDPALMNKIKVFVALAVYEHLPEQTQMLQRMARLLPADGAILLQGPTAGFPRFWGKLLAWALPERELPELFSFFTPPWHVCFPSPASLRLQASQTGLQLVSIEASPSGRMPGLQGILQRLQEGIAFAGFRLWGERWPLCMSHVFVLQPRA